MRALNEIIFDAYGYRPSVVVSRCTDVEGLHEHGNWFTAALPDMVLLVDLPRRPGTASDALAYALTFFEEQPTDTKIDLWKRFGPALKEGRSQAEFVYRRLMACGTSTSSPGW